MECIKCGKQLKDGANFCRFCGTQVKVIEEEKKEEIVEPTSSNLIAEEKVENNNVIEDEKKDAIEIRSEEKVMDEVTPASTNIDSSKKIREILAEMTPDESTNLCVESVEEENTNLETVEEIDEPTLKVPEELIRKYSKDGSLPKVESEEPTTEIKVEEVEIEKEEPTSTDNSGVNNLESEKEQNETVEKANPLDKIIEQNEETSDIKAEQNETTNDSKLEEKKEIIVSTSEEEPKEEIVETIESEKEEIIKPDVELIKEEEKTELKEEISNDEELPKKKRHSGVTFLIIILIFALCAIGYLLYTVFNDKNELSKIDNENIKLQSEIDKLKNVSNNVTNPTDVVLFNGYQIKLLDNSEFSLVSDSLVIKTNDTTINTKINSDTKYSSIKYSKDTYKKLLTNSGYIVKSYGTKVVNTKEYVVYEVTDSKNNNYLVAYTTLADTDVIAFIISNNQNDINYNILEETNKIVAAAKEDSNNNTNDIELFINNVNK